MLTFDYPQTYAVAGSTEEQLAQLRSYIWQLVDMLNQADDANEAGIGAALEKLRKELRDLEAKSGHGLPSGGTTGQALTKLSDRDYDTGWRTPAGGGGSGTVQSVNRVLPDNAGNVQLTPENVGAVDEDEELTILEIVDMWNNA
jgi:hypothetical protein